jgi:hypothetical protein
MKKQFKWSGGRDLHYTIKCTCPSEKWKGTDIEHLMTTDILLSGYADDYFFDEVNKEPRTIDCKCGKRYGVQWFRDGVECNELKSAEVLK